LRYRVDNRIQAYSIKNRPVLGLGWSFGEPQAKNPKERTAPQAKNLRYNANQADLTKRPNQFFIEQVWPCAPPVIARPSLVP
jgi:hypothetical protein